MSDSNALIAYRVNTAELHIALEAVLRQAFGAARTIASVDRRPAVYRSSFALEELTVKLDNGLTLPLIFKDVSRQALSVAGKEAKPAFLYDPLREIETYRQILAAHLPDAARCYGAVVDVEQVRYWLFLEHAPGAPLFEVGLPIWQHVARWLAQMHKHFAQPAVLDELTAANYLLRYDQAFYWRWPRRAQAFLRQMQPAPPAATLALIDQLVAGYGQVVEGLLALPVTLLHGEFYAANVLVQAPTNALRVCPVDWEMAALGPGVIDLAALIAGQWTEAEKHSMALAYYATLVADQNWRPNLEDFLWTLDCCRLHIAFQWLGWSMAWTPPAHQAQNWLGEIVQIVTKRKGDLCHIL